MKLRHLRQTISILGVLALGMALACSPEPGTAPTPKQHYEAASNVFLTRIADKAEVWNEKGNKVYRYTFEVLKNLKGEERETLTLNSPLDSCGFFHEVDTVILLYTSNEQLETAYIDELSDFAIFDTVESANVFIQKELPIDP